MKQKVDPPDTKRVQMAQRLRDAREYVGFSQEEVASALGISRPAVSNIESGERKVDALELAVLSSLYGRTVQYLLTGESHGSENRVAFLARATQGLTDRDIDELGRFAEFLRGSSKAARRGDR